MKQAVAYIRKSRVLSGQATVSWEVQEAKVRELAALHGDKRVLILSDWNLSGRKGPAGRPGYARLLEMIEADQVSAVYSYSMSRLSRSVQDLLALVALADKHGTPVRLVSQQIDTSHATGRMVLTILAAVDEMVADLASEQARDAVAIRRARGDRVGPGFYGEKEGEDPEAVVAAFKDAGSLMGAARLLNQRGVPTRLGRPWGTSTVHDVLLRLGAMPIRTRNGAKARAPYILYGLLRCGSPGCGHILTGDRSHHGHDGVQGYTSYRCHRGRTVEGHGPYSVPEKAILNWVMNEAARLRAPEAVEVEQEHEAERARIEARKIVLADMYETNGPTWRQEYQRRMAVVKAEEDALSAQEAATSILAVPTEIDWEYWSPEAINKVLTAMWFSVTLDERMQPVEASWRVPRMRAD
jgi:DNA invertase Pin-like site-specific DNA recombinase